MPLLVLGGIVVVAGYLYTKSRIGGGPGNFIDNLLPTGLRESVTGTGQKGIAVGEFNPSAPKAQTPLEQKYLGRPA